MTTYNTQNPVPSVDVRDLYDNAQNLDNLANGDAPAYPDRLGVSRKSWRGMENDFAAFLAASGFETPVLVYTDSVPLQVDRPTQLIERGGFVYSVKLPSTFPVVLSGTWATDEPLLVVRTDESLRTDLAATTGATLVGGSVLAVDDSAALRLVPLTTVATRSYDASTNIIRQLVLGSAGQYVDDGSSVIVPTGGDGSAAWVTISDPRFDYAPSAMPRMIDMHYGPLVGNGWTTGEAGGTTAFTVSSAASAGAITVVLSSASGLIAQQSIAILGSDGNYYGNRIKSIGGSTLTLYRPLPVSVAAGPHVFNFYDNSTHPNIHGFRAIADAAMRDKLQDLGLELAVNFVNLNTNQTQFTMSGGTTISGTAAVGVNSPSTAADLAPVFTSASGVGIAFPTGSLAEGSYLLEVTWKKTGLNGAVLLNSNNGPYNLTTSAAIAANDESVHVYRQAFFGTGAVSSFGIQGVAGDTLTIKAVRVYRVTAPKKNLASAKKIVMLGDSWFAMAGISARFREKMPQTQIINKGVGGNSATDLINRFGADVTSQMPDAVIIMTGTNDWFGSKNADLFKWQIERLITNCHSIGATVYIISSSVGNDATTLEFSRQYASQNYLPARIIDVSSVATIYRAEFAIPYVTLAAGANQTILFGKVIAGSAPRLRYANGDFSATQYLDVGLASNVTNATVPTNVFSVTSPTGTPNFAFTLGGTSWIMGKLKNTSAAPATFGGYVVIETTGQPMQ